jgi:hypothetical protein
VNTKEALRLCDRLGIDDPRFIEIEAKRRVVPETAQELKRYLTARPGVKHKKSVTFFDQFLDTPRMSLFKKGASLRIRYKGDASRVYLQYKGPGFHRNGLLYRSEFSTKRLKRIVLEESHHDIVQFKTETIQQLFREALPVPMAAAMRRHLGAKTMKAISHAPILCVYQKEKFVVDLGGPFLEPSIDKVFTFQIHTRGLHPLSSFCEYENEIKSPDESLGKKLRWIDRLRTFDAKLVKRFGLRYERLDKYHRCGSFFLKN